MNNSDIFSLLDELDSCPQGEAGWKQFEDLCIKIFCYLFVPPLRNPRIQVRTYSGTERRDAVFPNRNFDPNISWGHLFQELEARLILFGFKNYNNEEIGKDDVVQIHSYMREPMGRLAILCCNKNPNRSAHIKRNSIYSQERKVILFLTKEDLKEMIYIKERGEDPTDFLVDMLEDFYLQHE